MSVTQMFHSDSRFRIPCSLVACVVFALGFSPTLLVGTASAQTCVASNTVHDTSDYRRKYRISTTDLDGLQNVTAEEARRTIIASADRWNDQGNGRPFVYDGTTSATDVNCSNDYSLVVIDTTTVGSSKGLASGRCTGNSQFLITIYALNSAGNLRNWETDGATIGATEDDLMQTATHEFGHTLRQGHPDTGTYGVMTPTTTGENRQRDLYQVDYKCATNWSGHRRTGAYERFHHTNGTFNSEINIFGSWGIARISMGITMHNGTVDWAAGAKRDTCPFFTHWLNQADSVCLNAGSDTANDYIGPITLAGDYNATPWEDRLFHVSFDEYPTNGASGSDHRLRYMRSTDGFDNWIRDSMVECSAMSGWMTCNGTTDVRTGLASGYAWDDYNDEPVIAWAHQNRDNNTTSRRINVAVGKVGAKTLPQSFSVAGVQSLVRPGVVCKNNQIAGGYDCMVAVVPPTEALYQIHVYRFWLSTGTNRYEINLAPTHFVFGTNEATSTGIAAWFHDDRFWIAFRTFDADQNLEVWHSSDTSSWTKDSLVAYSDTGPSAASYWTGNNVLTYTK